MSKTIICSHCNKEVPIPEFVPDSRGIKEMLSTSLDKNGNSDFDFRNLRFSKSGKEFKCYWCGGIVKIEEPKPAVPPIPKPTPPPAPVVTAPVKTKKQKSSKTIWIILTIALLAVILFFSLRGCGSESEPVDTGDENIELVTEEVISESDLTEDATQSVTTEDATQSDEDYSKKSAIKVTDYSKEWAKIEARLKKLGSPLDYVSSNSSKDPSAIRDKAYKEYESIKDDAYKLYEKIKDQHYDRYSKLKDAKYDEYNKIKDEAYSKYQNNVYDYSKYSDIQSEAYDKYYDLQSKAYDTYYETQSAAYDRYYSIQSDAYDWQSKVNSITYGL